MNKLDYTKLEEYYNGEDSDSEFMEEMFEDEKNEAQLEGALYSKWEEILVRPTEKTDLRHLLKRIHTFVQSRPESEKTNTDVYRILSNAAVVVVIPLLAATIYFMVDRLNPEIQFTEIVAPKGEKAKFVLPDGSIGYLNSGSTIKYSYPFTKNRVVELTGEAFFEVEKNESGFSVQTQRLEVKVHGTRFNVSSYQDDPDVQITLEEGSVSVIDNLDDNSMTIEPGQQAVYNKVSKQLLKNDVDVHLYVSWKDNMLRFQNAPFADVVKKMERWYDVKIVLEENLKYTQRYTMTIKTESLREMLDLMTVTTPMKYQIKKDIVYITRLKNSANEMKHEKTKL